jgi:hypothetical protein
VVEDSTGHNPGEHRTLRKKDGAKGVGTLAQEGKTGGTIGVSGNEVQV